MKGSIIVEARKLADYISSKSDFDLIHPSECSYSNHIGALFTDIILQSGMNYRTVVAPRVILVLESYTEANTVKKFSRVIDNDGIETVINWTHHVKLDRMINLLNFCHHHELDTSEDLKKFLVITENSSKFIEINGIGNKTLDYLFKLLNIDIVAVDRHIYSFVKNAGIETNKYSSVKSIVEYAADLLNVPRRSIDYSIWSYMSYYTYR